MEMVDHRKKSYKARTIVDHHGAEFLSPTDKSEHQAMAFKYKLGIAIMCLSFPLSFHYSKKIRLDPKNSSRYLAYNFGASIGATSVFIYALWNRGRVEEQMANKYLAIFNDYEIEHFDQNIMVNIQRIKAY